MENSKVVIRLIVHGQKLYITNVQQSSYSFKLSKKPFSDNEVLKFNPDDAFKFVKGIQWSYPNKEVQIIDITGKTLNDVNGVINEEIKSFLTEGYVFKDDKLRFQQVINADFYNYQSFSTDYDADIPRAPITVNWNINF